jgi:hypothetical protein
MQSPSISFNSPLPKAGIVIERERSVCEPVLLGWREWLSLPELGIAAIKAKLDTGARTSSLHIDTLETFESDGRTWLRFRVAATSRRHAPPIQCEAPAIGRRSVTDSGGHSSQRWFIRTHIDLGGIGFEAEINLTNRRNMLFPMLLGRSALARPLPGKRFLLDPALSYCCGRPVRARS